MSRPNHSAGEEVSYKTFQYGVQKGVILTDHGDSYTIRALTGPGKEGGREKVSYNLVNSNPFQNGRAKAEQAIMNKHPRLVNTIPKECHRG